MSSVEHEPVFSPHRTGHAHFDRSWVATVRAEFRDCHYVALRSVSCELEDGVLTLTGRVPSYYLKQVAQLLACQRIDGRLPVENQLQVESDADYPARRLRRSTGSYQADRRKALPSLSVRRGAKSTRRTSGSMS